MRYSIAAITLCITIICLPTISYAEYAMSKPTAYQFQFTTMSGNNIKLSDLSGKAVLVVNTASQCGLTPQYAGLQELHEKYKDKGLVIIGVPSDNFGGQEFSKDEEVKAFTDKEFHVTFPLTTITNVTGKEAHPFYQWARQQVGFVGSPKWNFHKYLLDKNGNLVEWFSSTTSPTSPKVIEAVEREL